jgi:acetyl esterase/lipase
MKNSIVICTIALCLTASPLTILEAQPKHGPKIHRLWPKDAPGAKGQEPKDIPDIAVHLPAPDVANGAAIVICPGGGYAGLAMDHEGKQIAQWCNSMGVAGIILKYRVAPYRHPSPLLDAQRAIRFTRAHAKEWHIDPEKVGILGFSAGGHLASTAGTHFDLGPKDAADPVDKESCRPDFMVLCYPVITFKGPFAHMGSRNNLLGKDADESLVNSLCNETRVTKDTPPAFLVHTTEDKGVPPENSILFYTALNKHKVPAELHIFEKGQHGLGLGPKDLPFSAWPNLCRSWLQTRKILPKQAAG